MFTVCFFSLEKDNFTCGDQCLNGCWARGNDMCFSCKNYRNGNRCVQNCSVEPLLYDAGNNTCKNCHHECAEGCTDKVINYSLLL